MPEASQRLGVLGGSFNPIHHAHLFTAEVARIAFALDRVLLVPARHSPLKSIAPVSTTDRVAMAHLAAAGNPYLEVCTVDVDRPPPSYTVETIALLAERYQSAEFYLILGMDALQDLLQWRDPEQLLDRCHIIAVSRPGHTLAVPPPISQALGQRAARIRLQPMPELDISSTDLRRRLAAGEPVRYLLPDAVERYIRDHSLYGAHPNQNAEQHPPGRRPASPVGEAGECPEGRGPGGPSGRPGRERGPTP